jgi:predicted Zn-dependent peptidase
MTIFKHPQLPITIYEKTLSNGMKVVIVPRPGFHSVETILHVNFGARDERHLLKLDSNLCTLPQGTAHFLEHRIFESKGEQLSKYFAEHGATINASTGTTSTQYYFSTIRDYPELLRYFLNFIQTYEDTEEGVNKEAGIIHREFVRRYESQKSQIQLAMKKITYPNHHLSKEILGVESTILNMKKADLALAFRQYYRPNNLTLTIVGNIDVEATIALIESIEQRFPSHVPLEVKKNPENVSINQQAFYHELAYDITIEEDHFTIKFNPYSSTRGFEVNQRDGLKFSFMRKLLLNPNSPLYLRWQKEGLLSSSLSGSLYNLDDSYMVMMFEVHTKQPQKFFEALKNMFDESWDDDVMKPLFEGHKHALIGASYQATDNLMGLANQIIDNASKHEPYLSLLSILPSITYEEVKAFYQNQRNFETHFFHIIPKNPT